MRRSEVGTDYAITLARIEWDAFATMTFAGNSPHPKIAYGLAYRWLHEIAKISAVRYSRLLIALRGEEGEQRGRFHFHCLVGGTTTRNYHTLCHKAEFLWKFQSGGARVEVRQYDRALSGVAYIVKCLDGANAYELNKYSFANSVTLSESVRRLIAAIDSSGERHCREDMRKNGLVIKAVGFNQVVPVVSSLYDETASHDSGMVE